MKINYKHFIFILLSIISLFFVYNDDFIYKEEIMKITDIEIVNTDEQKNFKGFKETHYYNEITGIITNGKNKGEKRVIKYENTESSIDTDNLRVNDKVFIKLGVIDGVKRDFYMWSLILLFIWLIYLVGKKRGLLSVLSLSINILLFYIGMVLYFKGINLLFLCVILSIIFSSVSLIIAGGKNEKTKSAIISSIISIITLLILTLIVVYFTKYKGININELKFLTVPAEDVIIPELIMGSLGAIMDVAITICSAISELIEKDKKISNENLIKSSKEIGKDIMSTMSGVLFFTYIAAGLPIFVLAARNGYNIFNFINANFSLELTRFLVGSIGLIMTIPISTRVAIKMFRGDNHE